MSAAAAFVRFHNSQRSQVTEEREGRAVPVALVGHGACASDAGIVGLCLRLPVGLVWEGEGRGAWIVLGSLGMNTLAGEHG